MLIQDVCVAQSPSIRLCTVDKWSMTNTTLFLQAMTRVNPTVYNSIAALSSDPHTTVVVFSGSDKAKLDETFGDLNVWLAAENGIFMRPPPDEDGEQEVSS